MAGLYDGLAGALGLPAWLVRAVAAPILYPGLTVFTVTALIVIWAERKLAARVQMRVGPLYVSRRLGGALQALADGVRIAFQEVIVPVQAERYSFVLAPVLAFAATSLAFTVVPGGPGAYGFRSSVGVLVAYAFLSLTPILVVIMGWAASNKFTQLGGGREIVVSVAGEATLLASLLAASMMYGSMDFVEMVERQIEAGVPGILANPVAALLFFIAALLLSDRVPFDLVLGEQEIVQGPYTEYTGILFAISMALDYMKLYILMMMFADVFLGGWWPLGSPLPGSLMVYAKTLALMLAAVFLRAVYPRMRLDQVAEMFWTRLFPLALIAFAVSAAVHPLYQP